MEEGRDGKQGPRFQETKRPRDWHNKNGWVMYERGAREEAQPSHWAGEFMIGGRIYQPGCLLNGYSLRG